GAEVLSARPELGCPAPAAPRWDVAANPTLRPMILARRQPHQPSGFHPMRMKNNPGIRRVVELKGRSSSQHSMRSSPLFWRESLRLAASLRGPAGCRIAAKLPDARALSCTSQPAIDVLPG